MKEKTKEILRNAKEGFFVGATALGIAALMFTVAFSVIFAFSSGYNPKTMANTMIFAIAAVPIMAAAVGGVLGAMLNTIPKITGGLLAAGAFAIGINHAMTPEPKKVVAPIAPITELAPPPVITDAEIKGFIDRNQQLLVQVTKKDWDKNPKITQQLADIIHASRNYEGAKPASQQAVIMFRNEIAATKKEMGVSGDIGKNPITRVLEGYAYAATHNNQRINEALGVGGDTSVIGKATLEQAKKIKKHDILRGVSPGFLESVIEVNPVGSMLKR
jgi:hypothetical protein